jgi:hypothetical protein
MCLAARSLSAHTLIEGKRKHTRTSDTRAEQAHGGVAYHTAVCKVRKLLGRASYRTSESYDPGRCRKETDCVTEQRRSTISTCLGTVQRSGQEYIFPVGMLTFRRAHGCGFPKNVKDESAVLRGSSYLATHMY